MTGDPSSRAAIERLTDRRVLVTGGAGFIGGHLVESLADRNEVRVVDDFSTGSRTRVPSDAAVIEGDVRDDSLVREAMDGVDVVVHLAAVVDVEQSIADPASAHAVNVDGTLAVLEEARRTDTRVVVASSAAMYGAPESLPITEDEPCAPESPYGLDKLAVDRYARLYHDLYGLETVSLRPFNAYGPGQERSAYSGVVAIFLEQARAGAPITIEGDGSQTRDFVHVADLVRAFEAATVTEHVGEAFNVGTGDRTSITEVAETVKAVTGSESDVVYTAPREGDVDHSCAAISKAERLLGYEPRIDLASGLESMLDAEPVGR